ncbi:LacI family DNA-binding transcriptional regulator [Alisedimentitalea sp. MJ-SS2]|uniref:LacI family DNA-binding transcriptional regulator n=1 Tax=Aliisedimentitalea sp. MJ-SS2 TaxID=3049795 RepID=UPI00290D7B4B|nr:LacI family DNA-binding transcriptional regulator [Alisedimentitalea sp. MJ-SS2]MDU8927206.1 LacI family DNA-binding transcriptional regulator [Alisedimentitalea sp. MJ-SS2]
MSLNHKDKPDIIDVAKAARVSISTVSRSFNHPDLVKPATRKRIDRAVQKLGYIRNRAAQVMHGKRSGTIGLVVPTIDNAIFAELIQSFSDELDRRGFTMLIASHGFDLEREYLMLRKLMEHRVDGLAFIGLEHSDAAYALIEQQGVPTVAIWNYAADARVSCVGVENAEAGRLAARHLLDLGHKDVGLIFPNPTGNDRAHDRLQGTLEELDSNGIEIPQNWRLEAPYSIADAKRACMSLLDQPRRPTAILCGNDIIAQGVIYAAKHLGLKIPQDLSIMGIGDFKGSGEIEPSLSTIRIPAKSIGLQAAAHIVDSVTGQSNGVSATKCALSLLERDSTAAPSRLE